MPSSLTTILVLIGAACVSIVLQQAFPTDDRWLNLCNGGVSGGSVGDFDGNDELAMTIVNETLYLLPHSHPSSTHTIALSMSDSFLTPPRLKVIHIVTKSVDLPNVELATFYHDARRVVPRHECSNAWVQSNYTCFSVFGASRGLVLAQDLQWHRYAEVKFTISFVQASNRVWVRQVVARSKASFSTQTPQRKHLVYESNVSCTRRSLFVDCT